MMRDEKKDSVREKRPKNPLKEKKK